jgi:hypothetical protein
MKNKNIFFAVLIFTAFFITGCHIPPKPEPYSFVKDESESENGTAEITFIGDRKKGGVDLYNFEDDVLPLPNRKKYWAPITFPAGRSFALTVNVYEDATDRGNSKIFKCPALTAGKGYTLEVEIKKASTFLGITVKQREEKLVLRDKATGSAVYEQPL